MEAQLRPAAATPSRGGARTAVDLDADALTHCASFLGTRDLASMAMACKVFRHAAYSDSIWRRLFRMSWPQQFISSELSGAREAYLARQTAVQQFKFDDPLKFQIPAYAYPYSHLLLNRNDIILAQGSSSIVHILKFDMSKNETTCETLRSHNARITCMRLFPLCDTSLFRNEATKDGNVLVTSSSDHTIRLWWKGRSQRCFRGHNSPVTTLADRLLGNSSVKMLSSGGEDGSVRLWSFSSSGKRHPLVATFHGHERPISLLSVAGHNPSLLVSISKDAKIRVWDATASSAFRSSSCVGMTSVCGQPVDMKCNETLCYTAAGSSVTAIDLRTMQKVATPAVHPPKLYSFAILPSKSLICTGGNEKAMLWDVRKSGEKTEPVADLDGHVGRIAMIHIDPYKVVTGGPDDFYVKVWETDTGALANSLECCLPHEPEAAAIGLSAMAVDGSRIVTGGCGAQPELLYLRDYSNSSIPLSEHEQNFSSKFWEPLSSSDD